MDDDHKSVECDHAARCGGCPMIALPYGEQLEAKQRRVEAAASRYRSLDVVRTEPTVAASPSTGYRTRAKLIVAPGGAIGLYARGGHDVVDIPRCQVLAPVIHSATEVLRTFVREGEAKGSALGAFDLRGKGALRAVDLREVRSRADAPAEVLVTLVLDRSRAPDLDVLRAEAKDLASRIAGVRGIAVNFHVGDTPQILGNETTVLWGDATAEDTIGSATHLATYGSFVQAHRGQATRVHALVRTIAFGATEGKPRILDLYGGSGAIALSLAKEGAKVTLVESFAPAAEKVSVAAKSAGLDVTTRAGDVAQVVRELDGLREKFDGIVLNPPRRGVSPLAREVVARLGAPTLAYVSCDPETLARDLDHFGRLGYVASVLRPLDMIPLTEEVETVATLRRAAIPPAKVLYEDADILIVDKSPHEPTVPQGEYASSLLARTRLVPGAESSVPVHRLDVGASGAVVFARDAARASKWSAVLAAPREHASCSSRARAASRRGGHQPGPARRGPSRPGSHARVQETRGRGAATVSSVSSPNRRGRTRSVVPLGHRTPRAGDDRFGHAPTNRFFEEKNTLDRAFLHCVRIEFDIPRPVLACWCSNRRFRRSRAVIEARGRPGRSIPRTQERPRGRQLTAARERSRASWQRHVRRRGRLVRRRRQGLTEELDAQREFLGEPQALAGGQRTPARLARSEPARRATSSRVVRRRAT
ncbi:MAG: methyltransferase [Polyangiaceae bacterium]